MAKEVKIINFFDTVSAVSRKTDVFVPSSGSVWEINRFVGTASGFIESYSCLVWDYEGAGEEIVAATHGDMDARLSFTLNGDGAKKLAIALENLGNDDVILGVIYEMRRIG